LRRKTSLALEFRKKPRDRGGCIPCRVFTPTQNPRGKRSRGQQKRGRKRCRAGNSNEPYQVGPLTVGKAGEKKKLKRFPVIAGKKDKPFTEKTWAELRGGQLGRNVDAPW